MKPSISLAVDAFSDGQIGSKIWLCNELEKAVAAAPELTARPLVVWVLAGWHGLLPFLLFSRERLPLEQVVLFDLDEKAVATSLRVNDRWRFLGSYSAYVHDVNLPFSEALPPPDIVINTSCEHFTETRWWSQIREGTLVAVQSTDMSHEEHVGITTSADELRNRFKGWAGVHFQGELRFDYGAFKFTRHLVIGTKGGSTN